MPLRVISLDVWGTLIKGNPMNKGERSEQVAPLLGWKGELSVLTEALGEASRVLDKQTEADGMQYGTKERLAYACNVLGLPLPSEDCYAELERRIHDTQLRHPTPLTESDLPLTVQRWREEYGLQLAIICNTGTAGGRTLAAVLDRHGILEHIDFPVWSDDVGIAKPDPRIFGHLVQMSGVPADSTLHLGDTVATDIDGATRAGFHSLHYNAKRGTQVTETSYLRHSELHNHPQFKALIEASPR